LSEDGAHGLTIIAFIGSVFSPYYAFARARGRGDPENHAAMNVALYGQPSRWAMTERGRKHLRRSAGRLEIGASAMQWDGETLTISIEEVTVPLPSRLRGTVTVRPRALTGGSFALDAQGRHRWQPIAPLSDVVVDLKSPALRWRGSGYFDSNSGDEPLDAAFRSWTWSRFDRGDHARIFYDVVAADGTERSLSLRADAAGSIQDAAPIRYQPLPNGLWGVKRSAPTDGSMSPILVKGLEDAPFYTRSTIRSGIDGAAALGVHESLSLGRATAPLVRMMLPFRMPRRP
jgi:carotenoid 1,2-hydratase